MRRVVISFLALAYASLAMANNGIASTLNDIRLGHDEERTRIVFDVSGPVEYRVRILGNPARVVLEIFSTVSENAVPDLTVFNALIKSIELTNREDGTLGVELYLQQKVSYKTFLLKPDLPRGDRLVLDLYPGTADTSPEKFVPAEPLKKELETPLDQPSLTERVSVENQASASSIEFSGIWAQEWAVQTRDGHSQKFEALVEPRVDVGLGGSTKLTAIARIRLDAVGDLGPDDKKPDNYSNINGALYNDAHAEIALRELYFDLDWANSYWRVGKQQVVWGQADGIKVLDVVNPQSFREFILDEFDDSRIPLTMVNMQVPVGDDISLQLLWIPDTTYHELAEFGTPFFITSPKLVPVAPDGIDVVVLNSDVPDNPFDDSEIGARLSGFLGGWDVTVNYLYHYQDFPVFYQDLQFSPAGVQGIVSPEYERNHLAGGTLSNAFGEFTLRAEAAYSTDTFHISNDIQMRGIEESSELASVIGLDWQLGTYDTLISVQWFQSHLLDYHSSIVRDKTEQNVSLYFQRNFINETFRFDALALYSLNDQDSLLQVKLKYLWRSNIDLWLGADIFSGDSEGVYGQFNELDRVVLGLELGF